MLFFLFLADIYFHFSLIQEGLGLSLGCVPAKSWMNRIPIKGVLLTNKTNQVDGYLPGGYISHSREMMIGSGNATHSHGILIARRAEL
jgi:hypothetical protein